MPGLLIGAAVACGPQPQPQQPPPPPDPVMAAVIDALAAQRDRMCACTDATCVEAAEVAQFEWGFANKPVVDRARPTPAQAAVADALIEATEACAHELR